MPILSLITALALLPGAVPQSQSSDRPVVRSTEGALVDAYLTRLEGFGFQGAVLVAKDGQVVLEKGYGFADEATGRRNAADTPFLIASVAKPLVSLAIHLLESEGRVSIDDPLHIYFELPADKQGITIRHLLSHTSGLDDFYRDLFPELGDEEYFATKLEAPLIATPGATFRYSNFGYDLLRELVRRASGMTWEEYLQEEVYGPAGMGRTGFFLPDWSEAEVAHYQDWGPEGRPRYPARPLDLTEPHVCTFSTVGDLHRLHVALESEELLSREAQRRATTEVKAGYGLGWRTERTARNTRVVHHGGYDTAFGTVTGLHRFLDEDVVIVFLANTHMGGMLDENALAKDLEALVFGGNVVLPPAVGQPAVVEPEELEGLYELDDGESVVEITSSPTGLVARSQDERAILALLLPNAAAAADGVTLDETLAHLLDVLLVDGSLEVLERWIWRGTNVEAVRTRWRGMRERLSQLRGEMVSRRALHTRTFESAGALETHVYVLLEFERGVEVLRALRNAEGRWWIDPVPRPERVQLDLAPAGDGSYRTWVPRLGSSTRLRLLRSSGDEAARLELSGGASRVVLTRR